MTDNTTENYANWFKEFPWQVHITTRIPPPIPQHEAHAALIRDVLRPLAKHLRTQIASISIITPGTATEKKHIHTLALANNIDLSIYLPEIDDYLQNNRSAINTHKNSIVVTRYTPVAHPGYVAGHYTDTADIIAYNKKLLERNKQQC